MALSQKFLGCRALVSKKTETAFDLLPVSAEPKPHVVRGQAAESLVLHTRYQEPLQQDPDLPQHPAVKQAHFSQDEEHDRRPTSTPR